eukprot:scaffold71620_cov72-Phaeocystis_antarctica.AAC.3
MVVRGLDRVSAVASAWNAPGRRTPSPRGGVASASRWLVVNGAGSDRFPAATPSSPAVGALGPMRAQCAPAPPRRRVHPNRPRRARQVLRGPGRASTQPLPPQRGRARLRRAARAVAPELTRDRANRGAAERAGVPRRLSPH